MPLSSYYKQYDDINKAELERQKEVYKQLAETQKAQANQNADYAIKKIEDAADAQIKEAQSAYDGVIRTANVQRLIDERKVSERIANLGMTDSGLNRTQQTAVQLNRTNAINKAELARQKQIDALALEVTRQAGDINIQRQNTLTELDTQNQAYLLGLEEKYNANRNAWATGAYEADQSAAAARYKAKLAYDADMAKLNDDENNRLMKEAEENEQQKLEAKDSLIKILRDKKLSSDLKKTYVDEYISDYGIGEDATLYAEIENAGVYKFGNSSVPIGSEIEIANRNRVQYYVKNLPKKAKTKEEAINYIADLYNDGQLFPEEAEYITRYALETYEEDGNIYKRVATPIKK